MKKIGLIAAREFVTTVTTTGFLIGLLIMPALFALVGLLAPRILNARSPQVRGDVALIDLTGQVTGELRTSLDPATIEARRAENLRRTMGEAVPGVGQATSATAAAQRAIGGQVPALRIVERPAGAT